jgi:hypothetical protein
MAEHKTLAAALAAFQAEVPRMSKDETAKVKSEKANYTYGYAGLDQFVEIVEPVLGKHGLSVTALSTFDEKGNFILEVRLLHENGEELGPSIWPLPDPRRVGPQDIGSAFTYGRRYLGWGLTGTFPGGVDDDGQKAQESARDSWEDARPRQAPDRQQQAGQEPQAAPAPPAPKTSWTDEEVLKLVTPMPTAQIGKAVQVYDWMAGKGLHTRVVEMDYAGKPVKVTATDLVAGRIADEAMMTTTLDAVKQLQSLATNRGLMKVRVSESENLAEALFSAQELAQHALAEQARADLPQQAEQ